MGTISCKGIKPFSYQKDVIDELRDSKGTGKNVVVVSRRQTGKTTLISNLLLFFAMNYSKTKNYCVSPTIKQAKNIFRILINAIGKTPILKSSNATDLVIQFINDSYIILKSAEMKQTLRGETCTGLLCLDEAAYQSDDVIDIIRPWTDFHKAVTLYVSSPFIKEGYFWKYYNYGKEGTHNTATIDWSDDKYQSDMDKILSPERLEEYKSILPSNTFKTEYLGQFIDSGGLVFNGFKECIKDNKISNTDRLYVGIDWSNQTSNDDTVLSVFNQNGEQVLLKYWNELSPLKQIDMIHKELEPYTNQIAVITSESNSIGSPYTEMLKERLHSSLRSKIEPFNTSNTSKAELVSNIQVAFEQQSITLLNDEKSIRQFGYFSCEYNPTTKNVIYNAPQGLHDDIVMATMMAYHGLKNKASKGTYSIGHSNMSRR